jgi:hypothetical protein
MALASQELGADAMLLNSRKAPPEARHLGDYEVVFATGTGAIADDLSGPAGSSLPQLIRKPRPPFQRRGGPQKGTRRHAADTHPIGVDAFGVVWCFSGPLRCVCGVGGLRSFPGVVTGDRASRRDTDYRLRPGAKRTAKGDRNAFQRALVEEMESRFLVQPTLAETNRKPGLWLWPDPLAQARQPPWSSWR